MSAEEFESWVETLELMSNPKAVKALEQGLKEAKSRIKIPAASYGVFGGKNDLKIPLTPFFKGGISVVTT